MVENNNKRRREDWFYENRATLVILLFLACLFVIFQFLAKRKPYLLTQVSEQIISAVENGAAGHTQRSDVAARIVSLLEESWRNDFVGEFFLHASMACAVAMLLILAVELHASASRRNEFRRYREELAKDVWGALFGRMIPPVLVEELDRTIKANLVRTDCRYTVSIKPPYDGMDKDRYLIVRREMAYPLKNISKQDVPHVIKSTWQSPTPDFAAKDEDGNDITLPRHTRLKVDGKEIALDEKSGTLKRDKNGCLRILEHEIILERDGESVDIYMCGEEVYRIEDTAWYVLITPATSLSITVRNEYKSLINKPKVTLHHPNPDDLEEKENDTYIFKGGILPGQGFIVEFAPKKKGGAITAPPSSRA